MKINWSTVLACTLAGVFAASLVLMVRQNGSRLEVNDAAYIKACREAGGVPLLEPGATRQCFLRK